jgi:hypothetical protein
MSEITKDQVKCVKTLMGKVRPQEPEVLVMGFTQMRTGRVSEMTMQEGRELIKHLKGLDPDEQKAERMRRKLIGMAYERDGLGRMASKEQKENTIEKLNAWCIKYGVKHKPLNNYTVNELPALLTQYEKVTDDLLKRL